MERFHVIDDAAVILRNKSVFRQAKVFKRGDGLYAQHGAGFIRLYKNGGTGLAHVSWDDIELPGGLGKDDMVSEQFGKLIAPRGMKIIEAK